MELVDQVISDREVIIEPASQMTEGIFAIGMGILLLGVERIIALLEQNKNSDSKVNFKKYLGIWPHQFNFANLILFYKLQNIEGNT